MTSEIKRKKAPVIDLFSQKRKNNNDEKIVRISPEYEGISMLYGNDANPGRLFKLKLIAWGLQKNGQVVGLVPWLNRVSASPTMTDPLNGHWEGYYDEQNGEIFYSPPDYKCNELKIGYDYQQSHHRQKDSAFVIQELPDQIGTHAVYGDSRQGGFFVTAVVSWRLVQNGTLEAMLINPNKVTQTPVLSGDESLYSVYKNPNFKYFFQYSIANKVKAQDPEVLKAMSALIRY